MRRLLRNIALALFIVLVAGPVVTVILYRFIPPPVTPLMVIRAVEGRGLDHRWRGIDKVAPALPRALIAAEDARFCEHHGFDFNALQKAYANNEAGKKIRGGSTISQQTAKNVFLWPGRSYIRKGLEAWFTVLIEVLWGKQRIMEVYLNSIEFGSGIYGAQAAAQRPAGARGGRECAGDGVRCAGVARGARGAPSASSMSASSASPMAGARRGRRRRGSRR